MAGLLFIFGGFACLGFFLWCRSLMLRRMELYCIDDADWVRNESFRNPLLIWSDLSDPNCKKIYAKFQVVGFLVVILLVATLFSAVIIMAE